MSDFAERMREAVDLKQVLKGRVGPGPVWEAPYGRLDREQRSLTVYCAGGRTRAVEGRDGWTCLGCGSTIQVVA